MRRMTIISLAATIAILFTQATISQAQRGLPYGSYRQTCQDIRLDGNMLKARCQKNDGGYRNTSLDYRNCQGEVVNENGYLRCRQTGNAGALPQGTYKASCQNMHMEGNKLVGYCLKADGGWRNTSLNNVDQCRTQIVNEDGNLRCQK